MHEVSPMTTMHSVANNSEEDGYRALLAAVIQQAVRDAQAGGNHAHEAAEWIRSQYCAALLDCLIPFGLATTPEELQARLIDQLPAWARAA